MNTRLKYLDEQEWLKLARCAEWSVSELAKLCKVSVRGLELHLHKQMGKTPKNWLVEQRQKQAVKLLRDCSSVKEVAAQLAYKQSHHFSRDFKKHSGRCPTQANSPGSEAAKLRILV